MRALFAVLGFVAFYAVTAGAIVGLAWLGLLLFSWVPSVGNGKAIIMLVLIAGGLLIAAAVLAWSALPRIDKFEPPGPELKESQHPELFAMIKDIAQRTGQAMPVHVYAVLEVNAFVTERGGIMGIGSRRVMGIGLGLLNEFSVDEVRAVIAHEFGHFHGGDTRLGPWVYKTRAAMGRAVVNLQNTMQSVSEIETLGFVLAIIEAPFRWMALGYMRLASAVSRAQEFSADAVAARAVGTGPVLSGFGRLAGTAAALDAYLETEIGALVDHGVLPPVLSGARQFVDANRAKLAEIDADHAKFGEVSPFDSHPPLSDRIAAVERLGGKVPELVGTSDERRAIELVRHPEKLVRDLIAERLEKPLQAVEWNEVAPLFVKNLHFMLSRHRRWLKDKSVADLNRTQETGRAVAGLVEGIGEYAHELEPETLMRVQLQFYTAAISVALEHVGYEAKTGPGEPLVFHQGDASYEPGKIVRQYIDGELSDEAWVATWEGAGLHEHPWADVAWKTPPSQFAE
jgi:Zn-dependent protease with chaperone function